jgi:hypothetical protein
MAGRERCALRLRDGWGISMRSELAVAVAVAAKFAAESFCARTARPSVNRFLVARMCTKMYAQKKNAEPVLPYARSPLGEDYQAPSVRGNCFCCRVPSARLYESILRLGRSSSSTRFPSHSTCTTSNPTVSGRVPYWFDCLRWLWSNTLP